MMLEGPYLSRIWLPCTVNTIHSLILAAAMDLAPLPINDFTYSLPDEKIALHPLEQRDHSKLLVYKKGTIRHTIFKELPNELDNNSSLFFNDTKVIPARLAFNKDTGAAIEVFLLNPLLPSSIMSIALDSKSTSTWSCAVGNLKRWTDGLILRKTIADLELQATLIDRDKGLVAFAWTPENKTFAEVLHETGAVPLPPYIKRAANTNDAQRYQTVYSHFEGAVAAPTAGLHFTEEVIASLRSKGTITDFLTLHVSAGTFLPVKSENALEHTMHKEQVIVKRSTIENLLTPNRRVIAVGTTAMRTLESLYWYGATLIRNPHAPFIIHQHDPYSDEQQATLTEALEAICRMMDKHHLEELTGETSIYIVPGYRFRICKGLITNFHQPGSTLLLLIAAFIGSDWRKVYAEALGNDYRFLSYGDSSLLLP